MNQLHRLEICVENIYVPQIEDIDSRETTMSFLSFEHYLNILFNLNIIIFSF